MRLDRYVTWLLQHYKLVVIATVAGALVAGYGATGLTITNDMRAYFSEDNPQLAAFNALEDVFDRQDNLYFLVVPRRGDVYRREILALVRELTELGWQAPYSRRVTSLANYQRTYAVGDDLFVEDLVPGPDRLDDETVARIKRIAGSEKMLSKRIVAADGSATGINVHLTLPEGDLEANDVVMRWAREVLPDIRARHPDVEIYVGGTTATNVALGEAVERDLMTLVALSYFLIFAGLLVLLRHLGGTIAVAVVVTLAIVTTMGLYGWAGATLAAVAGFVPSVVMTIAVADSVHILVSYYHGLRQGASKHDAIRESLRINASPVFVTSVTTIIGVLTLNFSDSPPYRDLGNMVAIGVLSAYLLSMSLLPAILAWAPMRLPSRGETFELWMSRFAAWVVHRHRPLVVVVALFTLAIAAFIPRNALTERWHEYFDDTFEVRRALDAVSRHMGGLHLIRYAIDSGVDEGLHDPEFLAAVDAFAAWYEQQPGVTSVTTLTDTIKRLNRNLHGDDPAWYRLPATRELTAQYLLLYELSLPAGLGLENAVNVARSAIQLTAYVERTDSENLLALDRRARAWFEANVPEFEITEGTGVDMIFAHINRRNIRGLLKGVAVALVLISILLVFALRSLKLGLLSLLTNLAPAGLAYGTWGLAVGRLDMSASVVMAMSIGIVVDDTVHFLSKYLRARREEGLSPAAGIHYAFNTVGTALCITTAVLVGGFLVLGASHFGPSVTTGTLLAITLSFALVIDFLFLPPLLLLLDR